MEIEGNGIGDGKEIIRRCKDVKGCKEDHKETRKWLANGKEMVRQWKGKGNVSGNGNGKEMKIEMGKNWRWKCQNG